MDLIPFDPDAPATRQVQSGQERPAPAQSGAAEDELANLYDNLGAQVCRLALRLCPSSQEAEDLCHDVFLRFWRQGR